MLTEVLAVVQRLGRRAAVSGFGRGFVCLVASLLLLAPICRPAGAQGSVGIEPGVRVGDIRLGDSKDHVVEVLGTPELIGDTDTTPKSYNYQYFKKKIYVNVMHDKVGWIMCLSPEHRLVGGAGVGSSLSEIESALGRSYQRKEGAAGPELLYPSGVRVLFFQDRAMGIEVRPAQR